MDEFTPPRTRREWLMQERTRLYKALTDAIKGYEDLVSGAITSYSLGNRSVTRYVPDLNELSEYISKMQNRIAEIEAILNGRPIRNTSKLVFIDPTMIGRRW